MKRHQYQCRDRSLPSQHLPFQHLPAQHQCRIQHLGLLLLLVSGSILGWQTTLQAQSDSSAQTTPTPEVSPPKASDAAPVKPQPAIDPKPVLPDALNVKPLAAGQYVLEFNRSPIVGNRLRLQSIYDEARLRFTRPRDWQPKSVKLLLRFRHSPALYATRSNLTVLVNGASVGSVPLNRKQGELGTAIFEIPPRIISDYNEVVITALQNNSPTCTQDPFDPSLWTEILPDSKLTFDFQPQPIALNFNRYPYPIYDNLSLEPNLLAYLLPEQLDESWLTGATRLQTSLGRFAQFRSLDTRLVKTPDQVKPNERLMVIGTPKTQPALASLKLPTLLRNNQFVDQQKKPLPADVGIVMLTTTPNDRNAVLVATGNGDAGVAKAVQFLVQSRDRQIGTGRAIVVKQVDAIPTPAIREWSGYLPTQPSFQLKDLKAFNQQPLSDVTVRGADAPAVEFDFKALPDDHFEPGSSVDLRYSYSPQVNPLTSLMEVQLDGLPIVGKRLNAEEGARQATLKVDLPPDRIKPNSKLQVRFQLDPRERRSCNRATDQQLWATVHANTSFNLNRQAKAQVPDLKLLQFGYPFAAPQDLSRTAIVLPDAPSATDLQLMLEFAERLGRISQSNSVQLEAYRVGKLSDQQRRDRHLVAIGTQTEFPLPQAFQSTGFSLQKLFARQRDRSQVETLPDGQGMVKEIVSPWNPDRVLLALSAQTNEGLEQVSDLFNRDDLFFQLHEDTVLISANNPNPLPYDPQAYNLEFLQRATQTRELTEMSFLEWLWRSFNQSWLFLAPATVVAALILYGIFQSYLKRSPRHEKK